MAVEVVNVGDCPLDERLQPLIYAVREAVTNSAKHAGTGKVDVYAEVSEASVDVFVRDRGAGFELDQVAEDRLGVRNSIIDRMARHGGSAEVHLHGRRGHRGQTSDAPEPCGETCGTHRARTQN